MLTRFINIVGSVIQPPRTQAIKPIESKNPFEANPFTQASNNNTQQSFYGKNKPIMGGYFAGYLNGKPNIVGSKLFIEV